MAIYLLKFSACLFVFWLVHVFVLEKQNIHKFKRFYLLGCIVISAFIPLITFTSYTKAPIFNQIVEPQPLTTKEATYFDYTQILLGIYIIGIVLFAVRFIVNLTRLAIRIKQHQSFASESFIMVLLLKTITPHSFFQYLFLNKDDYESGNIPKEVMIHEKAHAKQLHSLDVIILELFQIILWFNPLIYLIKHHIKLNHEFLADEAVLKMGTDSRTYQNILFNFLSYQQYPQLSSSINYSSIKKRITVMKTHTSKTRSTIGKLLIIPIIGCLLYSFAERKTIYLSENPNSTTPVIETDDDNQQQVQEGVTKEQIAKYNEWAKALNALAMEDRIVKLKDYEYYFRIYSQMTKAQKEKSESFPALPPPPPPAPKPQVIEVVEVKPPTPRKPNTSKRELHEVPPPPKPASIEVIETPPPPKPDQKTSGKKNDPWTVVTGSRVVSETPPPPPPPIVHITELAEKGALFYYEGKAINSKKAVELVSKHQSLHVYVKEKDLTKPKVYLSKHPFVREIKKE